MYSTGFQRVRHDQAWMHTGLHSYYTPCQGDTVMLPILGTEKLIDGKVKAVAKIAHLDTGGAGT